MVHHTPKPTAATRLITLADDTDFDGWRKAARSLALARVEPEAVTWQVGGHQERLLGQPLEEPAPATQTVLIVPRAFVERAERVVRHAGDPEKFDLLYRILVRLQAQPQLLRQADVIVYDRLAPAELLREARPDAERIDAGKQPTKHRLAQAEINALLIDRARKGLNVALSCLDYGRCTLSAGMLGGATRAFEQSTKWAQTRFQFQRPLADFELVKAKIARMSALCYAIDAVLYMTTGMLDRRDEDIMVETAICKVFCSDMGWRVVNDGMQIMGGEGYMTENEVERVFRDSRINLVV